MYQMFACIEQPDAQCYIFAETNGWVVERLPFSAQLANEEESFESLESALAWATSYSDLNAITLASSDNDLHCQKQELLDRFEEENNMTDDLGSYSYVADSDMNVVTKKFAKPVAKPEIDYGFALVTFVASFVATKVSITMLGRILARQWRSK
jgi:hypothetical protein